jgi:hypothetical protein
MKSPLGIIVGINLLVLLSWTAYCRSQYTVSGTDMAADILSFSIPMAGGIVILLFLNFLGLGMSDTTKARSAFGLSILLVLLVGFGLCGWARP